MRADAASAERRAAFRAASHPVGSPEDNLAELWRVLARLDPLTRHLPPRRHVSAFETFLL
jgi:hypothetical protein